MAELEFKEYKGTGKDADGNDIESTVRAAQATEASRVTERGQTGRDVRTGEYVVETDRPGVYDVLSEDQWNNTGYGGSSPGPSPASTEKNRTNDKLGLRS